jgi:hypothetical protein
MRKTHQARTLAVRGAVAAASRPSRASAIARAVAFALVFAALFCAARPASAQFAQQGQKLVGSGAVGAANQGWSAALSADGNTAIVAGDADNAENGAVWEFTRSGGVWSQQGPKSVGSGAIGAAYQGSSVALSADGSTAIEGGPGDNSLAGAAWVFTLGPTVKLPLGSGAVGAGHQGNAVALSADGTTAIVGGPNDNSSAGAVWVYTQLDGTWTQQGAKLNGNGGSTPSGQGYSTALSADGNTAIIGGPNDNSNAGAVWFFSRGSNGAWTQQGSKLVGSGAVGSQVFQGYSVALSADGNTAIEGGPLDNSQAGAVWVFSRSGGGVWTQQGPKLFGSGAVGLAAQGNSVALSADGTTALVGGLNDNSHAGAAWVFTAPAHAAGSFTAIPKSGAVPLAVTFRANGLPPPMTYTVNFGDGTAGALSQASCFGSGNGVQCSGSASHSYSSAGMYYATLLNAAGSTLGVATITAGGNLVRPLRPPLLPRGAQPALSPPLAILTPTPERHSLDR